YRTHRKLSARGEKNMVQETNRARPLRRGETRRGMTAGQLMGVPRARTPTRAFRVERGSPVIPVIPAVGAFALGSCGASWLARGAQAPKIRPEKFNVVLLTYTAGDE